MAIRTATEKQASSTLQITVAQLGKRFNREWIFRKFDYTFQAGQVYAVTGPNGSGKSTLLQVLWGQLPQSTGTITYTNGKAEIPMDEIFNHIAIATPYLDLIEEFTLLEHLKFHFRLKRTRDGMREHDILEKMNLQHARDKHLANFSSGMKQRVKLGLAFFTLSDLLFLDEPTTNLDAESTAWYHQQLKDVPSRSVIFIASNQPSEYPPDAEIVNILDFK